jgi:hypothetical protein
MMLSDPPVGVPDHALGRFVHHDQARMARIVAQAAVCEALGDAVAWHLIVGDEATRVVQDGKGRDVVVIRGPLLAHQVVYGNRKGRGSRRR